MNKRVKWLIAVLLVAVLVSFWFALPRQLFHSPTSTVLESDDGRLLGARIAADGQWRFPPSDSLPEKYRQAVIAFEDKRFYSHPGVDPLAVARAIRQNFARREVVSGASTITMQLIRLSRKNKPRTLWQKLIETVLAFRAELRYSKSEILALYASHAPFGGNVVGLNAAAWRYFGVSPYQLSWGQTAALAVLPNAPGLIIPGRNDQAFKNKRDQLLKRLMEREVIDSLTCELACEEPLPSAPLALPEKAPHLMNHAIADGMGGQHIASSIDYLLQQKAATVVKRHHQRLEANKIHNMAAIIMEVRTGKVLAYIGNVDDQGNRHNNRVDVVMAPRSSGSTFKPFLYAAMLEEGRILPKTLVADVPVNIDGYSPKNFSGNYDGAVHADEVLYRSLNVPMVRMLKEYGLPRFHHLLKEMRLSTINRPPNHYGLSLILGGAETTLWELTGAYASMARILNHFNKSQGQYRKGNFHVPVYLRSTELESTVPAKVFSAAAIYNTFESLTELTRPIQESGWKQFSSSRKLAWKTGTSFGFRDAWAVGVTPQYAVGVWAGNADGEGRPGLTGVSAAAPVLMDLFRQLPSGPWFEKPWDELIEVAVCSESGHLATKDCNRVDTVLVPEKGIRSRACPYHRTIHLDEEKKFRVDASCYPVEKMQHESWFVLPPVMEWYYKRSHPEYKILPQWRNNCSSQGNGRVMQLVYPEKLSEIYIPTELDGSRGEVVFRVAHRQPQSTLFWYIDEVYYGQTKKEHQIALRPAPGNHKLTVTDEKGNSISSRFVIVEE